MGKKKDKDKDKGKAKVKSTDRPGRKNLERTLQELQLENEALRARLDKIAEIASADTASEPVRFTIEKQPA